MRVPINFNPRNYQAEALAALDRGIKLAIWCWARRGGKDFTAFGYAVKKMVEKPMAVVLVWPTQKQGFDNFWTNVENDGMKTLDHIPESLIASKVSSSTNMKITLKNGSTLTLLGATEADKLRGANAKLYIFSEFVDIDSSVYDVIVPVVEANGGQVIIQSTPKIDGISGGTFKMMFDDAIKEMAAKGENAVEYASLVTAHEYLTDEALERLRQKAIRKWGNDFFFRQEFLCDWGQASSTSYYGATLQAMEDSGRLRRSLYNATHPVFTAWDLGISDSTAIVFFQYYNKQLYIIDYFETHDIGNEPIVKYVLSKPYNYMWHFLPHDGRVRDSDNIERIEKIRSYGLVNSSLLKREPVEDGIKRSIEQMHDTFMDDVNTEILRRKMLLYKRKFNPKTGDYMGPEHNTNSHGADAKRYVSAAVEQEFDKQTGEFLYSPENQQQTYDSDLVSTPGQYRG